MTCGACGPVNVAEVLPEPDMLALRKISLSVPTIQSPVFTNVSPVAESDIDASPETLEVTGNLL